MIVKRGGRYGVSVYDKTLGRKRWVGTYATQREARDAEREAASTSAVLGRETCADYAARWLKEQPRKAAASRRTYGYALQGFKRDFATLPLRDLDKPTARRWALAQPRSTARVARAMFTDAINDGVHAGPNPFSNLRLEQPRGRRDLVALTEAELVRLAACAPLSLGAAGPTFRAMILFAAYVGLRPGELFALERRDVGKDEVTIRQSLDATGQIKAPKNGRVRTVILPPPAREALAEVPARVDVPWLFVTPRGRQFTKSSHLYYWRAVRTGFGRPTMDFYELRHFCATHLLELGVAHADVAVQLGHTDGGALVMSTYGHPSEDAARERLKRAYSANVRSLAPVRNGSQKKSSNG
jgi:integrase